MNGFNPPLLGNGLEMGWHDIRIVLDLFLGGLGVGAFLVSVIAGFVDRKKYEHISKIGAYISPIAVIAGLLLLISEIGQPLRFITTLWRVNPTSVLSWGIFIQVIFIIISAIYALQSYRGNNDGGLTSIIGGAGIIVAVALGVYHGLLLSVVQARALWNSPLIPVLFLASSIAIGTSAVILFSSLFSENKELSAAFAGLRKVLTVALLATSAVTAVYMATLFNSSSDVKTAAQALISGNYGFVFWLGVVVIGLALPLLMEIYNILAKGGSALAENLVPVGVNFSFGALTTSPISVAFLVLVGGLLLRYVIVFGGQIVSLQ